MGENKKVNESIKKHKFRSDFNNNKHDETKKEYYLMKTIRCRARFYSIGLRQGRLKYLKWIIYLG